MTLSNATERLAKLGAYSLATEEEIMAVRAILVQNDRLPESARVAYLRLEDPRRDAEDLDRRFRVFILNVAGGWPMDVMVSVTNGMIESVNELDTATIGELRVLKAEFEVIERLLTEDPRWLGSLATRNTDAKNVRVAPLSGGVFEYLERSGRHASTAPPMPDAMTTSPAAAGSSPMIATTVQQDARRVPGPAPFARFVAALAAGMGAAHVWVMVVFPHGPWVATVLGAMVVLCLKCAHRAWNNPAALVELLTMSALMALIHTFMALGVHEHVHGGENPVAAATAGAAAMLGVAAAELVLVMLSGIGLRLSASPPRPERL